MPGRLGSPVACLRARSSAMRPIWKALDDGNNLRVIPMVTFGAVGNVTDLLNLRGIDVAITQADVLDHFRREVKIPDIENRIQYISPLFLAEVHIYAREEFKTLKDLGGRKVAFNTPGSAANLTGQGWSDPRRFSFSTRKLTIRQPGATP